MCPKPSQWRSESLLLTVRNDVDMLQAWRLLTLRVGSLETFKFIACHLSVLTATLHDHGLVHRDLTVKNCMMNHIDGADWTTVKRIAEATMIDVASCCVADMHSVDRTYCAPEYYVPPTSMVLCGPGTATPKTGLGEGRIAHMTADSIHMRRVYVFGMDAWALGIQLLVLVRFDSPLGLFHSMFPGRVESDPHKLSNARQWQDMMLVYRAEHKYTHMHKLISWWKQHLSGDILHSKVWKASMDVRMTGTSGSVDVPLHRQEQTMYIELVGQLLALLLHPNGILSSHGPGGMLSRLDSPVYSEYLEHTCFLLLLLFLVVIDVVVPPSKCAAHALDQIDATVEIGVCGPRIH